MGEHAGRNRVELYDEEALAVLDWAQRLPGWEDADPKPLIVRRPSP